MKKAIILAAVLMLMTACTQKTETEVTTDTSGSASTVHVESSTTPAIDTAATAQATADATQAANDAAHAAGTAMETAGQKIQEKTDTTGTKN